MSITTKGFAQPFESVGRDLFFKHFEAAGAMSQADLESLVHAVQLNATTVVIGSFTAGASTGVNMVVSGKDVTVVAGYTVTPVDGF